mmetsp:Transcript_9401/g.27137  ORF Transcript_9401/g.27137 Transcript_9401/m.27137 type:complete len:200 (-) Transcript_9401:2359-2958(-)
MRCCSRRASGSSPASLASRSQPSIVSTTVAKSASSAATICICASSTPKPTSNVMERVTPGLFIGRGGFASISGHSDPHKSCGCAVVELPGGSPFATWRPESTSALRRSSQAHNEAIAVLLPLALNFGSCKADGAPACCSESGPWYIDNRKCSPPMRMQLVVCNRDAKPSTVITLSSDARDLRSFETPPESLSASFSLRT